MGYLTSFKLEWNAIKPPEKYLIDTDERIAEYIRESDDLSYALCEDGSGNESCKWYDHQKDIEEMSKHFLGVLFTLSGEGEEGGDLWKEYFYNGKSQRADAVITYDEPDLTTLGIRE